MKDFNVSFYRAIFFLSFFFRELQTKIFCLIGRLEHFVKSAEDLMKLVMTINNECSRELEKLEDQKKELSSKLYTAAM
jgi:hypothetical protein